MTPLVRAVLRRRYKRFLADVEVDGTLLTAHCPNPGSMLGLAEPGAEVWLSKSNNPKRKLAYGWELVRAGDALVGVNTGLANAVVARALNEGRIPPLAGYDTIKAEAIVDAGTRFDFRLDAKDRPTCWVEVKSVTLSRRPGHAEFPDAKTTRGAKHLAVLAGRVGAGERAVMLYLVQRSDCASFGIAADIDPAYAKALAAARAQGVEALVYSCRVDIAGIALDKPLRLAI